MVMGTKSITASALKKKKKDKNKEERQQRPEKRGRIWRQLGVGDEEGLGLFCVLTCRLEQV